MGFKEQVRASVSAILLADGPSEPAVLNTIAGEEFYILIVRAVQVDLIAIEPGQADSATFRVFKKNDSDEIKISPNDKITTDDEITWIVQTGVSFKKITGTWSVTVLSDRRIKA